MSLTVENIADFISAIGNLLQMGFRFWAFGAGSSPMSSAGTRTRRWSPRLPMVGSPRRSRTRSKAAAARSPRSAGRPGAAGRVSWATPPSTGCRKLRDTPVSAPAPRGECRGIPVGLRGRVRCTPPLFLTEGAPGLQNPNPLSPPCRRHTNPRRVLSAGRGLQRRPSQPSRLRHARRRPQRSNPKSRLPPPYASIHPARSAPLLTIQTVPAVDYAALPHHAI